MSMSMKLKVRIYIAYRLAIYLLYRPWNYLHEVNFSFVVSHLKIHPAVHLNTLKALTSLQSKRKVYEKFTSFRYSYVLTRVKKDKIVAERLDVQIVQIRILI